MFLKWNLQVKLFPISAYLRYWEINKGIPEISTSSLHGDFVRRIRWKVYCLFYCDLWEGIPSNWFLEGRVYSEELLLLLFKIVVKLFQSEQFSQSSPFYWNLMKIHVRMCHEGIFRRRQQNCSCPHVTLWNSLKDALITNGIECIRSF